MLMNEEKYGSFKGWVEVFGGRRKRETEGSVITRFVEIVGHLRVGPGVLKGEHDGQANHAHVKHYPRELRSHGARDMGESVAEGGLHAEPTLEAGGGFEKDLGLVLENTVEGDIGHFIDVAQKALLELLVLSGGEMDHEVLHCGEEVVVVVAEVGATGVVEHECCTGFFDGD